MDYLNVPIMLKYYVLPSDKSVFVQAGPYMGWRISKNIDSYVFETLADENEYEDFDFGVVVGGGISLNKNWEFFARYSLGFPSQIKNPEVSASTINSVVHVGVSYTINITEERLFQKSCRF